jgi:chromosome transmission fidelity protein 8
MILPIVSDGSCREYCIVELQGEVHHEENLKQGFRVGTLSAHPEKADTIFLQIGYHRLEGQKVPLKKPMVLLKRRLREHRQVGNSGVAEPSLVSQMQYFVYGHVTVKYIFKSRPKVLISQAR